ncbi:SpoIID/LytB domain-containing protein [Aeromicrobium sp. CTD01-1L150]|uniref:SpoIID/LytB domain-containing protein n=1 Tax=Aeromicrobium sp. CTD01-1L150 TaxID=3341830 RepID=UPI0035C24943
MSTLVLAVAVLGATVLAGTSVDGPDPRVVSSQGEESTLEETEVPLTEDIVPEGEPESPGAQGESEGEPEGVGGGDPDAPVAELERTQTDPFNMAGVTWTGGGTDLQVQVSYRHDGQWSGFETLDVEPMDDVEGGRHHTEPLWVDEGGDGVHVRITSPSGDLPQDVKVATIDPGKDGLIEATSATTERPGIIRRASWGAKPVSSTACAEPRYGSTRGATIHHTAGSNTYSQGQAAGILRSYQSYHQSLGWCDIGYNFLVDRWGRIYEGRVGGMTKMVRGAHAGTNGANTYTVGVAMMGTFTNVQPPLATRAAVADLVAWRFSLAGVPARGTHTLDGKSVQRIIGHRDVKATECPGRMGYQWVTRSGGLRDSVDKRLKAGTYRWDAPTGLKATPDGTKSLRLSWNEVDGAKKYVAQVSTSSSMSNSRYYAFSRTSGVIGGLEPDKTYHVRIKVEHSLRREALSPWSGAVRGTTYRWAAPGSMRVRSTTSSSVSLAWNAQAGAKKYVVQIARTPDMANPSYRAFSTNSGTISNIQPSTTYYVRVTVKHSVTNAQLSRYSSVASGRTSAATTSTVNQRSVGSASSVTFKGHGYGHGIGMSQWGAHGGAQKGVLASRILAKYYPGTSLASRSRYIRVRVTADNDGSTAVRARSGLRFLQGSRSITLPTTVSGRTVSHWRIEPYASNKRQSTLRYKSGSTWRTYKSLVWHGSADFAAPTMQLVLPGGKTVTYRHKLRAARPHSTATLRHTVNVVHLNDYTQGVVAREMPASWPTQALRAQAIAARTYGLQSITPSAWYDICDTTSCQVYGGVSAEHANTNAAVASTSNRVLMHDGKPAVTQYSSSSGGFTNQGSRPYLKAVSDPWDNHSANQNHSWSQAVNKSTIQSKYPSIGTLKTLKVTKRNGHGSMGGRVSSLQLVGSKRTVTISGTDARWAFGLKSDWFGF